MENQLAYFSSEFLLGLRLEDLLLLEIPLRLLSVQVTEVTGKEQKPFSGDSVESREPTHPVGIWIITTTSRNGKDRKGNLKWGSGNTAMPRRTRLQCACKAITGKKVRFCVRDTHGRVMEGTLDLKTLWDQSKLEEINQFSWPYSISFNNSANEVLRSNQEFSYNPHFLIIVTMWRSRDDEGKA